MRDYHYISYAQEVIFGHLALTRMSEALRHVGWERLMLCTSRSQRSNGRVADLQEAVGDKLVATMDAVQPHVQDVQLDEAVALADASKVDAIIGLGGGSPIGMAKAAAYTLEKKRTRQPNTAPSPTAQPMIPV